MKYYIIGFWSVLFYLISIANNDCSNIIGHNSKKSINCFAPQGWGFFTKSPRDAIVEAYLIENGNLIPMIRNNVSLGNFLGLSRNNRFSGHELSRIVGHIPKEAWIKKKGRVEHDLSDSVYHITTFDEQLLNFDYNRDYLIYQYKPMPFQWAGENQENYRPNLTALIKLVK